MQLSFATKTNTTITATKNSDNNALSSALQQKHWSMIALINGNHVSIHYMRECTLRFPAFCGDFFADVFLIRFYFAIFCDNFFVISILCWLQIVDCTLGRLTKHLFLIYLILLIFQAILKCCWKSMLIKQKIIIFCYTKVINKNGSWKLWSVNVTKTAN